MTPSPSPLRLLRPAPARSGRLRSAREKETPAGAKGITSGLAPVAVRLIGYETKTGKSSGSRNAAAFLVCEKLQPPLTTLMGRAGFRALLTRALALTSEDNPELRAVQVQPDGTLAGLEALPAQVRPRAHTRGSVALLTHLLQLLAVFIGHQLTLQLVREVWPQLPPTPPASGNSPSHYENPQ